MHHTTRRTFLKTAAAAAAASALPHWVRAAAGARKPNIILIIADDLGYADLGCFGSPHIKTPNLDKLAAQGVRFTDCYAAAPNCSPSRAGLLTGRTPSRTGMYSYRPGGHVMHLPAKEITLARLLKGVGYQTCHVGKWHLGDLTGKKGQPSPSDHGFDYWFSTENNAKPTHKDPVNFVRNGKELGRQQGYSCQIVADEAIRWLEQHRRPGDPFFMCFWTHEPHKRLASPPELIAQYPKANKKDALYYANVTNIDKAVGRLMASLDALDLAKDTFVFFSSDNGPWRGGSQGPLRKRKSFIYDGGIREPGIIRWPGRVKPGTVSNEPVGFVDMLPTLCGVAGAQVPTDRPIDGANILPALAGKPVERETPLFWYFYRTRPQCALRDGDWTIVGTLDKVCSKNHALVADHMPFIKETKLVSFELYNMREDIGQKNDLAAEEPGHLDRLKKKMIRLHAEVVAEGPFWEGLPAGKAKRSRKSEVGSRK